MSVSISSGSTPASCDDCKNANGTDVRNPFTAVVDWLATNPLISHVLLSSTEALALTLAGHLAGVPHAPILAAVIVSTFYYGRESGQREHDLKHMTPPRSAGMAVLGSFGFLWSLDNLVQWLAAAGATAAAAAALTLAGY
jgi:nitrogen fixation-related uncharacterized protein